MAPAPKARYQRRSSHSGAQPAEITDGKSSEDIKVGDEDAADYDARKRYLNGVPENNHSRERSGSPMTGTVLLRRTSAGLDGRMENVPVRASFDDIKQHLKHLGPSNPASNPKVTRSTTVKVKPGIVMHEPIARSNSVAEEVIPEVPHAEEHEEGDGEGDNETTSLLRSKITPKDGAHALATSYGATGLAGPQIQRSASSTPQIKTTDMTAPKEDQATQTSAHNSSTDLPASVAAARELRSPKSGSGNGSSSDTSDHLDAMSPYGTHRKGGIFARSGSITEQVVETRGIKKTVLETTSSADEEEEAAAAAAEQGSESHSHLVLPPTAPLPAADEEGGGDRTPLLGNEGEAGPSSPNGGNGNGNGGAKKKNRRKKKKGSKS